MLVPIVAMASIVAASPAAAAPAGNGWSCISPFATYLNTGALADDPPAPNAILNSLAIDVSRTVPTPLLAVPGQSLALQDLQLTLEFRDTRVAEQMYRRTGGATSSYSQLIPYAQQANSPRTLAIRANPDDGGANWWSWSSGGANPTITYVQKIDFPGEPPKVRDATTPFNTTFYYASPTLGLGHRYISHTGKNDFPLDAWVTISASNTVEGTQTIPVKGQWSINIADATPGSPGNPANYANDAVTATIPPVVLPLKGTRWTPTGAGPVEFTVAQPGNLGIVQIESEGYDRTGYNKPLNVRPFGSVFVRAGTEAYGASNDCIPGAVSLVNNQIAANQTTYFFLDADPTNADPLLGDPATPGAFTNQGGAQRAVGLRGRFGFAFTPLPAIATAPLPAAVPQATVMRPAAFGASSTVKPSKAGSVKLALTNPNTTAVSYKVSAKTVSKFALGKSKTKKVVTVASTKTVSLKAGASNVNLSLSNSGKTLLKQRKSFKVKVTLTPVSGGSAITKTITLKRS